MKLRLFALALFVGALPIAAQVDIAHLPQLRPVEVSDPLDTMIKVQQVRAMRLENERLRLEIEERRAYAARPVLPPVVTFVPPTPPSCALYSPADALLRDPEFNRLPMLMRIKFIRIVEPERPFQSNEDMATVLNAIALKVLPTELLK